MRSELDVAPVSLLVHGRLIPDLEDLVVRLRDMPIHAHRVDALTETSFAARGTRKAVLVHA